MWKRVVLSVVVAFLVIPVGYASAAKNGMGKWEFSHVNSGCPAIGSDGTIYIGGVATDSYGSLYDVLFALNPNGTMKWECPVGVDINLSSPTIGPDGTIYVRGSSNGGIYAINSNGTQKWMFPIGNKGVSSTPAIGADGTIYVGGNDGRLYAINPDKTEKWSFQTGLDPNIWGYPGVGDPALGPDGTIYAKGHDGKLYAISPDGTKNWELPTFGFGGLTPAIGADGTIYVGGATPIASNGGVEAGSPAKLYAVNPDGTEKWTFSTGMGGNCAAPSIGADGTIYVGATLHVWYGDPYYSKFFAIHPGGTKKWELEMDGDQPTSPAIGSDGTMYLTVSSAYGKLVAISPEGIKKWEFQADTGFRSPPTIGTDGTVYVATDSKLYAVNTSCGGLAQTPWPKFQRNLRNSGLMPSFTNILGFFDSCASMGFLEGNGDNTGEAQSNLQEVRIMISQAEVCQKAGDNKLASRQLRSAYMSVDGSGKDLVGGLAAKDLGDLLLGQEALMGRPGARVRWNSK